MLRRRIGGCVLNSSLLSLCLVNTLWHKYKKTYVDNFVPLMATTLIKHSYHKIENKDIKILVDDFFSDYGLLLTNSPTLTILQKCKKNKIIRISGKTYYINEEEALKFDISKELELNTEKQKKLLTDFRDFIKLETTETISDEITYNLVLSFIKHNDVGLFLFSGLNDSSLLPDPVLPHNYKRYKYFFEKYVSKVYNENKEIFRILVEIALGSIATNALLFSFVNQSSESIKDSEIYLDTSLILRLVGADEKENIENVSLLLNSIRNHGAKLKIYSHTYDECRESLETSLAWVESINFDPAKANRTSLYFRQEGYKKADVELIIASLDRLLRKNDISIEQVPSYTYENTLIDEKELQRIFVEEMSKHDRSFQEECFRRRTLRDIASICATSRLRNGKRYIHTIKDAKYLFVTTNGILSYANYRYNKENGRTRFSEIPECISDILLGTYLWASTPQIADAVNSFKIIAIALSAIKPDPEMEKSLQLEAKKLLDKGSITHDDYIIVTSSHLIKNLLSDKYFANASSITESSIYSILDEAKERLIGNKHIELKEINEKFYEEKQRRKEAEEKIKENESRYNNLMVRLETTAKVNAGKKSRRKVTFLKILLIIMICAPLFPVFFVSRLFLIIAGVWGGMAVLFSIFGCTFNSIKEGIYNTDFLKERKKCT